MPKAVVTTSKVPSAKGSLAASPSFRVMLFWRLWAAIFLSAIANIFSEISKPMAVEALFFSNIDNRRSAVPVAMLRICKFFRFGNCNANFRRHKESRPSDKTLLRRSYRGEIRSNILPISIFLFCSVIGDKIQVFVR